MRLRPCCDNLRRSACTNLSLHIWNGQLRRLGRTAILCIIRLFRVASGCNFEPFGCPSRCIFRSICGLVQCYLGGERTGSGS